VGGWGGGPSDLVNVNDVELGCRVTLFVYYETINRDLNKRLIYMNVGVMKD
jgi:hypothetical protein